MSASPEVVAGHDITVDGRCRHVYALGTRAWTWQTWEHECGATKSMDIYGLKPGDRVRTIDGTVAEILNETQDGQWIKVRYVESDEDPSIVGTEDLCHQDELQERIGTE